MVMGDIQEARHAGGNPVIDGQFTTGGTEPGLTGMRNNYFYIRMSGTGILVVSEFESFELKHGNL